jgi:hypothetical protein
VVLRACGAASIPVVAVEHLHAVGSMLRGRSGSREQAGGMKITAVPAKGRRQLVERAVAATPPPDSIGAAVFGIRSLRRRPAAHLEHIATPRHLQRETLFVSVARSSSFATPSARRIRCIEDVAGHRNPKPVGFNSSASRRRGLHASR